MNSSALNWPVTSRAALVEETLLALAGNSASNHSTESLLVLIVSEIVAVTAFCSTSTSETKPVIWPCSSAALP